LRKLGRRREGGWAPEEMLIAATEKKTGHFLRRGQGRDQMIMLSTKKRTYNKVGKGKVRMRPGQGGKSEVRSWVSSKEVGAGGS